MDRLRTRSHLARWRDREPKPIPMTDLPGSVLPDDDSPTRPLERRADAQEAETVAPLPDRRRGAVRNTALNGLSRIVSIVTSFLLTPVILHVVGTQAFGLWVLIGSVVAYGSLLDLGIGGALTKYVAEHQARDEARASRQTIATGLRLYLVLGAVMAVAGIALAPLVPSLLAIPPDAAGLAVVTTAIMAIGLGIAIPCTTATAVLRGLHRYDIAAAIAIVGSLLSVASTLVALAAGWGIVGVVGLGIPIPITTQVLAVAAIRKIAPDLLTGPRDNAPGTGRRIIGFSWPLLLLDVAGRLQSKSDEIVVGVVLSLGSVAPYALGRKLSTIPRLIAEQFAMLLLPLASELNARDERARLQTLYLSGVRISLAIALPLTGCLVLLAGPILAVWVGAGFDTAAPIVVILAIAAVVDLSLWPAGFVLQGIARHRWLGPISLASGLANLALSVALARPYGIIGVAIGTLVPTTIEAVLLLTPFTLRTLDIAPGRFVAQSLLPAIAPAVPMLLVLGVLMQALAPTSIPAIAALVVLAHVVYGLVYLVGGPAAPERAVLRDLATAAAGIRNGRPGPGRPPGSTRRD
jgi:O-antigen/teichoic acid export membrane protein